MIIIAKSELFPNLSEVIFAEKDPDKITSEILSIYESLTGRTLARADPVRLFLDAVILSIIQQRNLIDFAAKQNLLAYASGEYLDHIGALLGVSRLEASHAVTTIRFTLSIPFANNVVIPSGTRVSTGDGAVFSTVYDCVIPKGTLIGEVTTRCVNAGTSGNGYAPGQVNRLVDVLGFGTKAENITETSGGTDAESDENFRERIQIAPESFSVAGPKEAYRYFARSANADIIDVAVMGPPDTNPGYVDIYPLMTGGTLPSDEVLGEVLKVCSAENVRPDTDYVSVKSPVSVNYSLNVKYWIDDKDSVNSSYIRSEVESEVEGWILWQRQKLGRDINPSELIRRVINAGAKRCEVSSPEFRVLKDYEVGMCVNSNVEYGGLEKA
ncbi:MAG: baseplate J/gp47 family protein [Synergistaceae bacterium]|nr:baseplate J/gp47 family protein [Synergistaceae bacterium]